MEYPQTGNGLSIGRLAAAIIAVLLALPAMADWKQAVAYYNQGQFEKAIQELKPDIDKNPDWEPGHRIAGLCYLKLKNNALAISELTRAVQLKSTAFATYSALAQAYFNTDKIDDCIQSLNQGDAFAKDPADLYILRHLRGAAYYREQKYDQAVADLTAAIRIKSTDWVDFSQLGAAYYNLGRYDDANQALQKALSLKPDDDITKGLLGKTYFKQGVSALSTKQYNQALDLLRKAGSYTPNDGYVFYNTGEAYLFLNNFPEAEKAYNQALTLLPGNGDVLRRLGFVYEKEKKWDQALNAYKKASELGPAPDLKEAINRVSEMKKQPPAAATKKHF